MVQPTLQCPQENNICYNLFTTSDITNLEMSPMMRTVHTHNITLYLYIYMHMQCTYVHVPSHSLLTVSLTVSSIVMSAFTRDGRFSPTFGLPTYTYTTITCTCIIRIYSTEVLKHTIF